MTLSSNLSLIIALPMAAQSLPAQPIDAAAQQAPIRSEPIAGVYNAPWYSYLSDVREAEKELGSDLKHSTDAEDRRDAWEEYNNELTDADKDYVKEMRHRGYRAGRVTVG